MLAFFGVFFLGTNSGHWPQRLECSPMARETWVQSQVESYQKTLKMVLDTTLLNTQHYKVRFKGKVEQSWEWSSALPYTLVVAIEKGAFGSPSTMVANFTFTNHGQRFASPLTHSWLIGSEALPCSYHLVIIKKVKKRRPLPLPLFGNYGLLLSTADGQRLSAAFSPNQRVY